MRGAFVRQLCVAVYKNKENPDAQARIKLQEGRILSVNEQMSDLSFIGGVVTAVAKAHQTRFVKTSTSSLAWNCSGCVCACQFKPYIQNCQNGSPS